MNVSYVEALNKICHILLPVWFSNPQFGSITHIYTKSQRIGQKNLKCSSLVKIYLISGNNLKSMA